MDNGLKDERRAEGDLPEEGCGSGIPEVDASALLGADGAPDFRCCSGRTKKRSADESRRLIHRLSRIEGQVRGIRGMVERDAYCIDILTQLSAVSAALSSFRKELLASHIRSCVVTDLREGRVETAEELIDTLEKMLR